MVAVRVVAVVGCMSASSLGCQACSGVVLSMPAYRCVCEVRVVDSASGQAVEAAFISEM